MCKGHKVEGALVDRMQRPAGDGVLEGDLGAVISEPFVGVVRGGIVTVEELVLSQRALHRGALRVGRPLAVARLEKVVRQADPPVVAGAGSSLVG
jgi:hypothetical protein